MDDLPESETLLYGVKEGNEDWQEEILSTCPDNFDDVKVKAARDGFSRFRIAKVNLTALPNFARTVNRNFDNVKDAIHHLLSGAFKVAKESGSEIPDGVLLSRLKTRIVRKRSGNADTYTLNVKEIDVNKSVSVPPGSSQEGAWNWQPEDF